MYIHKEGRIWILGGLLFYILLILFFQNYLEILFWPVVLLYGILFCLVLNFFRNPIRKIHEYNDALIYAPADGKVVVIEETQEDEYFGDKRIMVSIFMNPLNVHCNRYPISGKIKYSKYHPGKYFVAWHPKSSTQNERTTVVIERNDGCQILLRQIAGAVARRICCYSKVDARVQQGDDFGFIKFGSRVDLYLPLNIEIKVHLNQIVKGNLDIIGKLNEKNSNQN